MEVFAIDRLKNQRETNADRHYVPASATLALDPIRPQKVYVIAANQLAERIKAGVWLPGTRLPPERELSDMLGISRASVRQALMALESIGILHSKRGVGRYVKSLDFTQSNDEALASIMDQGDPQELLEARRVVEPEVARLAALYRDVDDLTHLYDLVEQAAHFEAVSAFELYLDADFQFHLMIGYATHNPVIIDIETVIVERMKAPAWKAATYTIVPKNLAANRQEHVEILEAIVARKPRAAFQAMEHHLSNIARNLRNISAFQDSQQS